MDIAIARALLDRLLAEAAANPAREVCGLLFGEGPILAEAVPAANVAADPAIAFEIDPAALFAALRQERAGGTPVIGHYHSHPNGSTRPSPCDAAAAGRPGRIWLILGRGEAAAWREVPDGPVEGAFESVPLRIRD